MFLGLWPDFLACLSFSVLKTWAPFSACPSPRLALFIYLFRDAGGRGAGDPRAPHRGAGRVRRVTGALRTRPAGLEAGEGPARVGGASRPAALARLRNESRAEESIVIYCVAAARCARGPALARECVCARVCVCERGARAGGSGRARGKAPKTP